MGYTHYTTFNKKVSAKRLAKASADVKKAFELVKTECPNIVIKDGWGEDEAVINDNIICFNGDASKGEDHEGFCVEVGDKGFNFCKTASKPYDVYVCVACLILKEHFGADLCLTSDGIRNVDREKGIELDLLLGENEYRIDNDWQKPIAIYKKFKGII